ncbi:MAG: XRE family transcriptional regulator [Puniceicoccaceae bacterium]|nr:MAG: XRE family transcriptional regulator [Puniceicoccaceae bacterium]
MGKNIETKNLTQFGNLIAGELEKREMKLSELADAIGSDPASMSRFLHFKRRPPGEIIDKMVSFFGLSGAEGCHLHRLAENGGDLGLRSSATGFQPRIRYRTARRFAEYDLNALMKVVAGQGWHCEVCKEDDPFSYDVKVAASEDSEKFVAVNFPDPRKPEPDYLLRKTQAMQGIYKDLLAASLFYEGVAGSLAAYQKGNQDVRQLQLEASDAESTDAWLQMASGDKGRIVHGGNLVQVLAEYLEPTEAVRDYLKAEGR